MVWRGRRASGLAIIIAVLLAALTGPLVAGQKIAGRAIALMIQTAPKVGDCLVAVPPGPRSGTGVDSLQQVVSCALPHDGEVITQTSTILGPSTNKRGGGEVPDLAACARTAYWYIGVHPPDGAGNRSIVLGPWWPAFSADFEVRIPSSLQVRVGQSWAACVMTSPHGLITGGVSHLFGGPPRSSPIALCTPHKEIVLEVAISCDQPHAMEIVGWRVAAESTDTQGSFNQSCVDLVRRITGMTDPTAQGALQSAVAFLSGTHGVIDEGWGPGRDAPYRAACTIGVTAERLLTGSLTGLGSAPVPWA